MLNRYPKIKIDDIDKPGVYWYNESYYLVFLGKEKYCVNRETGRLSKYEWPYPWENKTQVSWYCGIKFDISPSPLREGEPLYHNDECVGVVENHEAQAYIDNHYIGKPISMSFTWGPPKIYAPYLECGSYTNESEDSLGGVCRRVSHSPIYPWCYGAEEWLKKNRPHDYPSLKEIRDIYKEMKK